jgi:uncharacterized cupredoxin-like copper-binding protein
MWAPAVWVTAVVAIVGAAQNAPKILIDQPARAVEYQLSRLTADELVLVERKADDIRYKPVYVALLTRKGVAKQYRDEAVGVLATLDKATPSRVLLDALAKVAADDSTTADKLVAMVAAQPAATLRQERDVFAQAIDAAKEPFVLRGAYAALLVGDNAPDQAWKLALQHEGQLIELLRAVPQLPEQATALKASLFTPIAAVVTDGKDTATRTEALGTLGSTRRDAATFALLAKAMATETDASARAAAIRSLEAIPESAWAPEALESLAGAIVAMISASPTDRRTDPLYIDAAQFGDKLAAKLPPAQARTIKHDLRSLGVQVVKIQTLPEKVSFDVRWFAVEAGKPLQLVLVNPDAMPHNLVVGAPGSLKEIGPAGGALPLPADPEAKAFVPDTPKVLYSTKLVKEGETARLSFNAPKEPGEYVFVCTFPGHWVRMYGVMLVVPNLDAWEARPTVPVDPMTSQPFAAARN